MDESRRITVDNSCSTGSNLEFFVVTGSVGAPIVCPADNNGFPYVRDIYARQREVQGHKGIHVSVRCESSTANGREFAINVSQPGMEGDYTVIPMA